MLQYLFDVCVLALLVYLIWCAWTAAETDFQRWSTQQRINQGLIDVTQSVCKTVHQYDLLRQAKDLNHKI